MDPNHFPEKISDRIFNQGDFTISTDTLKDYNADEVVLLLRHGATFMPVHDNAWVYFHLFSLYYASSEWEEERLCMFKALVNTNESLKDDIYPYLMHLDIEEVDLLHYLVDIGTNIFFIDEKGATLYSRARAEHGVYFARHLKARQQFVNPLFTTMVWRLDEVNIFKRGAKRHRIE